MITPQFKTSHRSLNPLQYLLAFIRLSLITILFMSSYVLQQYLFPLIFVSIARRFLQCFYNLFFMRAILLLLGVFRYECDNFRFFSDNSNKFHLKSGYVSIVTHHNILDFIFYNYLFSPVFARIIICEIPDTAPAVYYAPLDFKDATACALHYRGFDPIIVKTELAFRQIRYRKMALDTLISQCFQETRGPILMMLPSVIPGEHIAIPKLISDGICQNEQRYQRSGIGLHVTACHNPCFSQLYPLQKHLIIDLVSQLRCNDLRVVALEFKKCRNRYSRETYHQFVDGFFKDCQDSLRNISYAEYLDKMNQLEDAALKETGGQQRGKNLKSKRKGKQSKYNEKSRNNEQIEKEQ